MANTKTKSLCHSISLTHTVAERQRETSNSHWCCSIAPILLLSLIRTKSAQAIIDPSQYSHHSLAAQARLPGHFIATPATFIAPDTFKLQITFCLFFEPLPTAALVWKDVIQITFGWPIIWHNRTWNKKKYFTSHKKLLQILAVKRNDLNAGCSALRTWLKFLSLKMNEKMAEKSSEPGVLNDKFRQTTMYASFNSTGWSDRLGFLECGQTTQCLSMLVRSGFDSRQF